MADILTEKLKTLVAARDAFAVTNDLMRAEVTFLERWIVLTDRFADVFVNRTQAESSVGQLALQATLDEMAKMLPHLNEKVEMYNLIRAVLEGRVEVTGYTPEKK